MKLHTTSEGDLNIMSTTIMVYQYVFQAHSYPPCCRRGFQTTTAGERTALQAGIDRCVVTETKKSDAIFSDHM